jgi:hypothetical protein
LQRQVAKPCKSRAIFDNQYDQRITMNTINTVNSINYWRQWHLWQWQVLKQHSNIQARWASHNHTQYDKQSAQWTHPTLSTPSRKSIRGAEHIKLANAHHRLCRTHQISKRTSTFVQFSMT